MKTIAYYISDYGFGHATRSIAVISELMKEDVNIIISTSFPMPIVQTAFEKKHEGKITYRYNENDLGFITKMNSIDVDIDKMNVAYDAYISTLPERVIEEEWFLEENNVDLVISDISPAPFLAAKNKGIRSIGISNFTWYTAYLQIIEEHKLTPLKEAYEAMDYYFALAGVNEPDWAREKTEEFGFFARKTNHDEKDKLLELHNRDGKYKLIYLGLGMKIDIEDLDHLRLLDDPNVKLIVSSNIDIKGERIINIPATEPEAHHYTAIADVVITKPGWGTVGEAICNNKPLILINRSHMQEDANTINFLMERKRCMLIEWEELFDLRLTDEKWLDLSKQMSVEKVDNQLNKLVDSIKSKW
ncbi:hypothetical protein [Evansella cellulosilytica]|uniref:Glycosyl transferase family 28 C-terminal domain-containing protein n=1 Tax=Evansella cellulosilytica (strain ATCC 21833 / DSM 2522 / FERM P-1141 / JCM 9156 / N-4) TaxID=649639 RepID=E6TSD1_EVAC2|nr:hypothetical protein [Evansella cellulosilytica]ADU31900.1 hypothetical protein Bcell_3659 [Evansella cellulosilytica DSM 2522]